MFEKEPYIRHSSMIYTLLIYQGALFTEQCSKGDVSTVPYRVQDIWYSADLPIANLVDARMLCLQSSVMRKESI